MKNKKVVVGTGCLLIAILAISAVAFTMQGLQVASEVASEPQSLKDLTNYPGDTWLDVLSDESITSEIMNLQHNGTLRGVPLEGYSDMRSLAASKGYHFNDTVSTVFMSDICLTTPEGEAFMGRTYMQWSEIGPNGTKDLLVGTVMKNLVTNNVTSIMLQACTNVLPPIEVGVDPYIIWNAEPYFYIQWYWWRPWPIAPGWRIISWYYWWYDSHSAPNWFWGPYWWWRTYLNDYYLPWYPWYWGWWSWYYGRGWYWWSTYWPY